ncbi:MAG: translocation/assembly module TamB domain-containing protein, partial [Deltaproteobacteria bacterium]|nr:translocation/assembly module TamB domain-containing protein [Deltaproteobacteria bacterium]
FAALLYFCGSGDVWRTLAFFLAAQVGFVGGNVFYDAFLPHIASADRHFRAEVDTDVAWRGEPGASTLSGSVVLLDAKYDREFHILEEFRSEAAAGRAALRSVQSGWDKIGLDITVRNTGDCWIRNNAADVALRVDGRVRGSLAYPEMTGAIEAVEGKLHYLGLNFDIAHGLMEFHAPYAHPYIEMTGEKDVREYLVRLTLRGPADNLELDLSSTPGLERKDILALLAFGATQDELRTAQFGAQIGPSVFLEQVGKIVERPLARLTGLDVVRIETQTGSGGNTQGSRLYLGKRISDRLAVEFVTGISEQAAEQGFQVEYNLTDFLLLKAAQPAGEHPRVSATLRFKER